MSTSGRVGVVGAGLVGLAVARRLAQLGADVTVLEKEDDLATHQSGHNSGVVHAGLYYQPGSLKATLCRRGAALLREFCAEHSLELREIGKVVVARDEAERGRLAAIEERAKANGVPGVRWLEPAALHELEPNVTGVAALHSPTTAIVDYRAVARAMADDVRAAGGRVLFASPVTAVDPAGVGGVALHAGAEWYRFDRVVLCAGLQSDVVARLAGDDVGPAIVPFRGEYYRLVPERADLVRGLVYPVPDPAYPFLGVHLTPRVDGSVDIGPNAVLAAAREGYRRRDVSLRELADVLRWPGARRLFRQHWQAGAREMRGSLSKRAFVAAARAYVPDLRTLDVVRAPAGVRAQAVDADGSLVDDFRISQLGPVTAVRNAPSPAATSSLAIAEHIVDRLVAVI
ncbi:L-2-hydroxyglutarate oxidase [Frankia sp. CNm7]|uniref:L-2-hydroxyglutarate oxidase n=1 Tax=Frankia nepalensis TaxID=1836974 RepID=A0A937UPM3_9ACTN|nr:L-2-hydroxyglutarate oxidase [Frankia nepalensis]MBL7497565.1 L-2-hydroxyglutarate oxidase [Frankia nepalensis]MBL7509622.1 L-2-hydroxyglutarate oxidase [Frankia nepalensis]MBL7517109.1 L-2-hydroxyglutarate oxidase [Frankia nepalensis]MBL7631019.1 L-2-hydroxyglutarate oxidase [Frankia nepalensis]